MTKSNWRSKKPIPLRISRSDLENSWQESALTGHPGAQRGTGVPDQWRIDRREQMTARSWREAWVRLTKRGWARRYQSVEPGERGEHYHIMLVCNYKLSYPRVNPARYISPREHCQPANDSSRSIPFGFHPLRGGIVEESTAGGPRSLVFSSKIKSEKWYDYARNRTIGLDKIRLTYASTNQTRFEVTCLVVYGYIGGKFIWIVRKKLLWNIFVEIGI